MVKWPSKRSAVDEGKIWADIWRSPMLTGRVKGCAAYKGNLFVSITGFDAPPLADKAIDDLRLSARFPLPGTGRRWNTHRV